MEDVPRRAPRDPPAWVSDLHALKRRVYTVYLAVAAVLTALLLRFPVAEPGSAVQRAVHAAIVVWLAIAVLAIVAMRRRPGTVVFVERLSYAATFPMVIGTALVLLAGSDDPNRGVEHVRISALWLPVGYVWAYVAFGTRGGLVAAAALLAAFGAAVNLLTAFGPRREDFAGTVPADAASIAASATVIVALYVMSTFVRLQTRGRAAAEALARYATVDALTGLPNRRGLDARLDHDLATARRERRAYVVCFVDLDDLKGVNDTYGHRGGDDLITAYADRLRSAVRATDLVARMSGDEFVVAGFVHARADAATMARKLLHATDAPFTVAGDHVVRVGASVGVSVYPDDAEDAADLLRQADVAMYAAKLAGKNRWRSAATNRIDPSRTLVDSAGA